MKRALTVRDIAAKKYDCYDWEGEWLNTFGNPSITSMWTIQGISASGKSSFAMQFAKKACEYGQVLYLPYEEGASKEFQRRLAFLGMHEVQSRLSIAIDETIDELDERLSHPKSAQFIFVDSFQLGMELYGWSYEKALELMRKYPKKTFVYILQEDKGQPLGKPAKRLKYMADMKVRVAGYRAYCQGRASTEPGNSYIVWEEGVIMTSNGMI